MGPVANSHGAHILSTLRQIMLKNSRHLMINFTHQCQYDGARAAHRVNWPMIAIAMHAHALLAPPFQRSAHDRATRPHPTLRRRPRVSGPADRICRGGSERTRTRLPTVDPV